MTLTRTQKHWAIGGGIGALALGVGYEVLHHRKHATPSHDLHEDRGRHGHHHHDGGGQAGASSPPSSMIEMPGALLRDENARGEYGHHGHHPHHHHHHHEEHTRGEY